MRYRILKARSLKQLQVGDFLENDLVTDIKRKKSDEWLIFFKSGKVIDASLSHSEVTIQRPLKKFRGLGNIENRAVFKTLRGKSAKK